MLAVTVSSAILTFKTNNTNMFHTPLDYYNIMRLGKILNKMLHNLITEQPKVICRLNKNLRLQMKLEWAKVSNIIMVNYKWFIYQQDSNSYFQESLHL